MNSTADSASPTTQQLVQRSLTISRLLCGIVLVFPALIAVGWIVHIPALMHGQPELPAMRPNTAVGLTLTTLSILFTPEPSSPRRRSTTATLLALVVLLLGLLISGEYIFGWDFGIDRLFAHAARTASDPFPGRPSPQTALNFVLLGAVLLSMNLGQWPSLPGQIAVVVAGANAIAAVTGYLFGSTELYEFPQLGVAAGMDIKTAVAFVFLVAAILCRRPTDGMMTLVTSDTLSGLMARRVLLAGIAAPPLVGALTRLGVAAGWYDVSFERSLFVLILGSLIVRTTWRAARYSEQAERQAQAAREALERTREEWASIVAHDLRQPISTIALRSSMLQRTALSDGQRADVQNIRTSADRLSRMVSDLTDAALLETGHLSVTLERLDLTALLRDTVHLVPVAAPLTELKLPSLHVFIAGDAQRLQQVITNLLTNAVKYGTPGTRIVVELKCDGGRAELSVINRGQGIPSDEIAVVFERYVRSREAAARKTKGLGLGLYICKGLVDAHGGRIWADSIPGDVTTFHVSLPLDGPPVPIAVDVGVPEEVGTAAGR
jgi:signal transduction histidine kinase